MTGRYRIRRKTEPVEGWHPAHPDGTPITPYGLWDTIEHRWVDKFGMPDDSYWACCRDVAVMRRRDLNAA